MAYYMQKCLVVLTQHDYVPGTMCISSCPLATRSLLVGVWFFSYLFAWSTSDFGTHHSSKLLAGASMRVKAEKAQTAEVLYLLVDKAHRNQYLAEHLMV